MRKIINTFDARLIYRLYLLYIFILLSNAVKMQKNDVLHHEFNHFASQLVSTIINNLDQDYLADV